VPVNAIQRATLSLDRGADGASSARRQTRILMDEWGCDDGLVDDTLLVLSELVANAILHAGHAVSVTLVLCQDRVRVEVADASSVLPAPSSYDLDAHTGRGLTLVGALAERWGAEAQNGGKLVWAEVPLVGRDLDEQAEPVTASSASGHTEGLERIVFLDVPVSGYLALQQQNDAISRDVDLLLIGQSEGLDLPVPDGLLAAAHRLRDRFEVPAGSFRLVVLAASAAGQSSIDLEAYMPPGVGRTARAYVELLEEIEEYAAQGYLFIDPPDPATVWMRRWFIDELIRQQEGLAPAAMPSPPLDWGSGAA
jgi:anti-sigma regulatory factor (Ser/Thr protein kinase)